MSKVHEKLFLMKKVCASEWTLDISTEHAGVEFPASKREIHIGGSINSNAGAVHCLERRSAVGEGGGELRGGWVKLV